MIPYMAPNRLSKIRRFKIATKLKPKTSAYFTTLIACILRIDSPKDEFGRSRNKVWLAPTAQQAGRVTRLRCLACKLLYTSNTVSTARHENYRDIIR